MGTNPTPAGNLSPEFPEFGKPEEKKIETGEVKPAPAPELQEDLALTTLDFTRLAIELRNAIEAGSMRPADIRMWTSRPWMAYEFLVGKMDKNVANTPFLNGLREWNFSGAVADEDEKSQELAHEEWAKKNPELAQKLTIFVRDISARLDERLNTYEKVQSQFHEQKEIATTDQLFFKARDMLKEHPGLPVAGLLAIYWLWNSKNKLLRGTARFSGYAAAALGIGAAYGWGRQTLGMEPLEWAAGGIERLPLGGPQVANALRSLSDTLSRGPKLASGKDFSVLNFFHDKFGINGMDEKAYFNSLCEEHPQEFLEWYDNIRTWKLTRQGNLPDMPHNLRQTFQQQVRLGLIPQAVASRSREEQANALLRVAEKTMASFKNDPEANGMDPVAFLKERYVTGEYFTRLYEEWAKEWTAAHGAAGEHTLKAAKEYAENMKESVAKSPIKMLDIFLVHLRPEDFEKLPDYGPGGKSLKEIYDNLTALASKTGEVAYEGLGRAVNFATIDVPETSKKIYEYLKTKNIEELNRLGITEESVGAWMNDFVKNVQDQTEAIRSGTKKNYEFAKDSEMWKFLEENLGIYGEKVGDIIFLTDDAIMFVWDNVIIPARDKGVKGAKWLKDKILNKNEEEASPVSDKDEEEAPNPSPDTEEDAPPPADDEEAPPPANEATPFPGSDERPFPPI